MRRSERCEGEEGERERETTDNLGKRSWAMGRKSSSSPGEVGGGGGVGPATMMGLRMIQCGRQTVHVVQPDGQVRQFVVPVRVADLLRLYPHCFVSHAATTAAAAVGSGYRRRSSANILPYDAYLETGSIYAILPLPRLFPSSPPPSPHFCSCFFPSETSARFFFGGGLGKAASSKISPDVVGLQTPPSAAAPPLPRRLWEPDLEIIAEEKVLVVAGGDTAGKRDGPSKGRKLAAAALDSLRLR